MKGETQITGLPEVDPPVPLETGGIITVKDITRLQNRKTIGITDFLGMIETSHTSTESIQDNSEEVHHKTEVINQGQTTDRDLGTDTGHTAMNVTIRMPLHTEVETEEVPPHTIREEEIKVTTMTSLNNTEGSHVALHHDTAMMAEITDRVLGLKEECLKDREVEIPDSHQQEVDNLSSDRDLTLVVVELRMSNVGGAEELAT